MFDHLLLQQPARQLALQAVNGRDIANTVMPAATPADVRKFELLLEIARKRFYQWEVRKPATGGYNCAGHALACRRTAIFQGKGGETFEDHVRLILAWDGFTATTRPRTGDLVLYWDDKARGNLLHLGVVNEVRSLQGGIGDGVPHVLSKWDAGSGECLHHVRQVPANFGEDYEVEYWTDLQHPTGAKS